MDKKIAIMMQLFKCSAMGIEPGEDVLAAVEKELLPGMYTLAYHHDLDHLLGNILDKYRLLGDGDFDEKYRAMVFEAIYRYEKIDFEFKRICECFEENSIDFMPLKGSVLRKLYAEPWLRTSSDADILVKEKDLKRAEELLEKMSFDKAHTSSHDITYTCGEGVIIELHFSLSEVNEGEIIMEMLNDVWKHATLESGKKHQYMLDEDFFYFYHVAHAAKHFVIGGCGIKPVLDLYIMRNARNCETTGIKQLLKQSGLERFELAFKNLCGVWFDGQPHDDVTAAMEEYILEGGVYGTIGQQMLLRKRRLGSKSGYVFSRVFVPRRELEYQYPALKESPSLLPLYEMRRWGEFILNGDKKQSKERYEMIKNVSEDNIQKIDELFKKIGL